MLDVVSTAIDRFYKKKDYRLFKSYCEKPLELFKELRDYIEQQKFSFVAERNSVSPSRTWYIDFEDYKKGEFEVSYNAILNISKVVPLFYIQHEFDVKNRDENSILELDGFGNQPYVRAQEEFHNKVATVLKNKGYYELGLVDFDETVPGFKMPEKITIFGPDVTVEYLLFVDVFDICSKV